MSSPIAKGKKSKIDLSMIAFHKKFSHSHRVNILSEVILSEIKSLNIKNKSITLLDVGCGDMSITNILSKKNNTLLCTGIDIYPNIKKWKNYKEFDGQNIPFKDDSFDIVIFCDVLHHTFENIGVLLKEAKRVANFIIIKDHFEYGFFLENFYKY